MVCCGSSAKLPANPTSLLNEIRKIDELPIKLMLNKYVLNFNSVNGLWKSNEIFN